MTTLDAFTRGYIECALWLSDPEPGSGEWTEHDDYTIDNIAAEAIDSIVADCKAFQDDNAADLAATGADDSRSGHDFFLTRNHHGCGFWDRGYEPALSRRLTDAAHVYGSSDLYMGDDGSLYVS